MRETYFLMVQLATAGDLTWTASGRGTFQEGAQLVFFDQHYFQDESEANMAPTGRTALQAHFSIIRTWICRDATFT